MNLYEVLFAKKLDGGGGGGEAVLIDKSITANGTYNASSDSADGYKKVVVNVPNPSTGTIQITQNGTVNVTNYASAEVNVPSYEDALLEGSLSGAYENNRVTSLRTHAISNMSGITSVSLPSLTGMNANSIYNNSNLESLSIPNFKTIYGNYGMANNKKLEMVVMPKVENIGGGFAFNGCTALHTLDFGATYNYAGGIPGQSFASTSLNTLILRKTSVVSLANINVFNSTPFASGGAGGILYVPNSTISSYQSASNWSTILGYANNQIKKIEGTIYETQYADGTPIGG